MACFVSVIFICFCMIFCDRFGKKYGKSSSAAPAPAAQALFVPTHPTEEVRRPSSTTALPSKAFTFQEPEVKNVPPGVLATVPANEQPKPLSSSLEFAKRKVTQPTEKKRTRQKFTVTVVGKENDAK